MTTTIDKFGRILIPKAIRKELGLEPGSSVDLLPSSYDQGIILRVTREVTPKLVLDSLGIPTFHFATDKVCTIDFVAAIKEGREERDAKIIGA